MMQRLFNTIILHVCLFLAFFQLCYKVSERGITLLLNFFRSIISWVSTFTNSTDLNQIRTALTKLFSRPGFTQKCESWRNRHRSAGMYTDLYDGTVRSKGEWPVFLPASKYLSLVLNIDWFNPFKHIEYSVGVIYLVIGNLPRSERYKMENVIVAGVMPGLSEPKKHMNSYLKPLVDELLKLSDGTYLLSSSLFIPIRCALKNMCMTCDLPATRKACGFTSFSSTQGCSKCFKWFPCETFGKKSDFSGYDRDTWPIRIHNLHLCQVDELKEACTAIAVIPSRLTN